VVFTHDFGLRATSIPASYATPLMSRLFPILPEPLTMAVAAAAAFGVTQATENGSVLVEYIAEERTMSSACYLWFLS
jgi:hypothetical protein